MIAEATTRQQERRRDAARQKTVEEIWEEVARRRRAPMGSPQTPSAPLSVPDPVPAPPPPPPAARVLVVPSARVENAALVRKPWPTFADVLRKYGPEYRRRYGAQLTEQQDKVLREMLACYTPLLGMHEWTCGDCGTVVLLPNGCNNRHCCTCGGAKRRRWAETTREQIVPLEYCHVVLTVPQPITQLAMLNKRVMYSLVLRVGAEAIKRCGWKLFGIELALLSLLHTWGQLVNDHVHNHSLLPMGGLRVVGDTFQWVDLSEKQIKQLLKQVEREFPKLFCKALRKAYNNGELRFDGDPELAHLESPAEFEKWLEPLENISWVIRPGQRWDRRKAGDDLEARNKVIEYLANYANRVALSDARILQINGDWVLFKYKDYRDNNQQKTIWIEGVDLIHRFLNHLLPPKMHHIRRYGWMARRADNKKLEWLRQYHGVASAEAEEPKAETETDEAALPQEEEEPTQACRFCDGTMHMTGSWRRPRVDEVMRMPLSRFRRAQAGARIKLGDKLPEIQAQRRGNESSPAPRDYAAEIARQLNALPTSGYL